MLAGTAVQDTVRDPLDSQPAPLEPWAIPAVIGAELAQHAKVLESIDQDLRRTKSLSRGQLKAMRASIRSVHRIALQSQQLTRLAAGRLRQSHERIALEQVVERVLEDGKGLFAARGLVFERQLQPVEVIVDPGLLHSLVESAMLCMGHHGNAIAMWLHVSNWPEHALLTLRARQLVRADLAGPHAAQPQEPLEWLLLTQLAQAMGVGLRRESLEGQARITLEFPRTVKRLQGLTAIEIDAGDAHGTPDSRPLAGHRLLLVSDDAQLREALLQVCRQMRLVLDVSPSVQRAVRYCELDKPDLLVTDARLNGKPLDELRADLRHYDVNFPFIEITDTPDVVEISGWTGSRVSRISRNVLPEQLNSLLVMELARVF